ncbi:MAG: DNA alkylation repair protein [Bacteroidota bacterium]
MSGFSLRDQLFNASTVDGLAARFSAVLDTFERDRFVERVLEPFPDLQLKARIDHMATVLRDHLPPSYADAVGVIVAALPPPLDPSLEDDDFGDFILAPLSRFVALYGCTSEHFDQSVTALRAITMRFSAEDAIRAFINAFPDRTYAVLDRWSRDDNYHVRRLVSEGTRPRLPWSGRLAVDATWPLALLDRLHADPTRYVTRSVANHINDISKSDPALAVRRIEAWQTERRQRPDEMAFIARHALRGLVKAGDSAALRLLGYGDAPALERVRAICETPEVRIGERLQFGLTLAAEAPQSLLVDYRVHFARPDDRRSAKVYRLGVVTLEPGTDVRLRKRHLLRQMTTRRLYSGTHRVDIVANGTVISTFDFELVGAD